MRPSPLVNAAMRPVALALALVSAQLPAQPAAASARSFSVERTGRGKAMILIPGLTSPGSVWDATVAHFRGRFQVHVLTLAGFAGVAPVERPSLERVRDDLIEYVRSSQLDRPVIVGHSLGGMLAYWVAATVPDLVGAVVALDGATFTPALFDTSFTPEKAVRAAEGVRSGIASLSPEAFKRQSDAMLARQITDSTTRARIASAAARSDPTTTAEYLAASYTLDLREASSAIRAPVLLLVGTAGIAADARTAYLESARRQVARIRSARVVEMPRARHFIMLDDPNGMHGAIDEFLHTVPALGR